MKIKIETDESISVRQAAIIIDELKIQFDMMRSEGKTPTNIGIVRDGIYGGLNISRAGNWFVVVVLK